MTGSKSKVCVCVVQMRQAKDGTSHFLSSIASNILWLPEQRLQQGAYDAQRQPGQRTIPFRMEGDVFGPSGIAQVRSHPSTHAHL